MTNRTFIIITLAIASIILNNCGQIIKDENSHTNEFILKQNKNIELNMRALPKSENPLVVRTDFTNENAWIQICKEVQAPNPEFGFLAHVDFCNDTTLKEYSTEKLLSDSTNEYAQSFIFFVDKTTVTNSDHPILCVGLKNDKGKQFRVIPSEMWSVENNLSISNMDFDDFLHSVDNNGVFRGFHK
jgi:hypothetical protein